MMRSFLVLGVCLAAAMAWGEALTGNDYLLQTKHTTMAFCKEKGLWHLAHYGERLAKPEDARKLAFSTWVGSNMLGNRRADSYSVYGSDVDGESMNKFGGLAVIHADGVTSTALTATGAEIVPDAPGMTHLVISMKDAVYPFFVKQHFRAAEASDVVETWVELSHEEPAPVKLIRMDSLALVFPLLAKEYYLMTLTGQWASEGQISEAPVALGQTISMTSRSGVRSAFGNNPSFMLSIGGRSTETSGRVLGGTLAWSGTWSISVQRDCVDTLAINAGADTGNGAYTLDPKRTLTTPKMVLTYSANGKGQVSRNFHRWARDYQLRDGHLLRPVLLNSWEGAYFDFTEKTLTDMMDGVKQLGGEMFVIDDGWFARGKYARDDDKRGLGDWVVNEKKLPHGLAWLAGQAKERGLKFGLWVEPEMANTASELVDAHPDWVMREKTRTLRQGRGGTEVVLDLSNPAVRDNVFSQMDKLYASIPDLSYIKWDANASIMNAGSAYLGADRQPNIWFDYTEGLYDILGRLHAHYPQMLVNACSSGGGHMDYGFLRYADEFWASDDTDARERVFIQWGASQFYPACAIDAHVTVVPNHQTHRTTPLKFRFDVAMAGRLGFELHPKNMKPDEVAFAQRAVVDYKRLRPVIQQGDLYRLVSPWDHSYASLMYVNEDASKAVVFLWGLTRGILRDYPAPLQLQGLDASKRYQVTELNLAGREHSRVNKQVLGGDALMGMGLPVKLEGDFDSAVFELEAAPAK